MAGQWWRCRKSRRDAGGTLSAGPPDPGKELKYDLIDLCRNGVIPLTFHENMRMTFGSGGPGILDGGGCELMEAVAWFPLLRFAGGGLISRSMFSRFQRRVHEGTVRRGYSSILTSCLHCEDE